jgi:hypothetical protein
MDMVRFLRSTEESYWRGMKDYLKDELRVGGTVTGTAVGYTTAQIAAETVDFVDSHAYWRHPSFPGRPWDANNWVQRQDPMVNSPQQATLAQLAVRRVFGMPYTVTEYNHPSPHHYEAEGFPLAAVYASFQDWDGVFPFNYDNGGNWEVDHFDTYFSTTGNPVKLAVQPACADIVRRGRVGPAALVKAGSLSLQQRLEHMAQGGGWPFDPWPDGLSRTDWLFARVGVAVEGHAVPETAPGEGTIVWAVRDGKGLVRYTDPTCAGLIGFGAGTALDAGSIRLTPGPTSLDGFSVVMLNAVDGQSIGERGRCLLTVMSRCANEGMVWNEAGTSVGREWGRGPTLCEGVPVTVAAGGLGGRLRVFALNADGTRAREVPAAGGRFELGAAYRTLWYELVVD